MVFGIICIPVALLIAYIDIKTTYSKSPLNVLKFRFVNYSQDSGLLKNNRYNIVLSKLLLFIVILIGLFISIKLEYVFIGFLILPIWLHSFFLRYYGKKVTNSLLYSIYLLLLTLPMQWVFRDSVCVAIQTLTANTTGWLLSFFLDNVYSLNTFIWIKDIYLHVDSSCAGINMFLAIFLYSYLFAVLISKRRYIRLVIVTITIPIAFTANVFRVFVLSYCTVIKGNICLFSIWHDIIGYLIFIIYFILIWILSKYFIDT